MGEESLRNEAGQTLEEFLEAYRPGNYERPAVTVDMVVLTEEGEVLLIRRKNHPNIGSWALPGGFIEMQETLHQSAARELQEETGLTGVPLHALGVFGEPSRDPRMRIVTSAFAAVVPRAALRGRVRAGDDAADAGLFRWSCEDKGEVDIPRRQGEYPQIILPCNATGDLWGQRGWAVCLRFEGNKGSLSALLAVDQNGEEVLLASPAPYAPAGGLASDHALIVFAALRRLQLL